MKQLTKIVIKVGSNVLTREDSLLNTVSIQRIVSQITYLRSKGIQVVLVSSGAVAAGRELIELTKEEDAISRRQVFASIGQARLMHIYYDEFKKEGLGCAQVLVAKEDFRDRRRYKNMRNCLSSLWRNEIIPIVNENDVVSITELMFTDNDELAGLLTSMTDSEALIILTNVNGVYDMSPDHSDAQVIKKISFDQSLTIDKEKSSLGRGGMRAKLAVSQKVASLGANVFITNGYKEKSILSVFDGTFEGTQVISNVKESEPVRWVAHADIHSISSIIVDSKFNKEVFSGNKIDLLEGNIVEVNGDFIEDDVVKLLNNEGVKIGVGKVNCSKDDLSSHKVIIDSEYLYLNIA